MNALLRLRQRWQTLFPRNAPVNGWITLGQRRLYVLPTRLGLAFVLLLGLMFAGAVNYNLSLGYGMLFWLCSIMLISALHANLNLAGLRISAHIAGTAFAGDQLHVQIAFEQDKPRLRPLLTLRQDGHHCALELEQRAGSADLPLPALQRGWFTPGRITLETRYPLGLFRCWTYLDLDVRGLVYPRPEEHAPPLQRQADDPRDGGRSVAGGDEFSGLREWRPGDAPRLIAWRQSARNDRLLSRVYSHSQGDRLWLDWSNLPAGLDTEQRLARLCRWVLDAEAAGMVYGLRLPGVEYPPDNGPAHRERCLAALALF